VLKSFGLDDDGFRAVALRIRVDEKNPFAFKSQSRGYINRGRSFSNAAFLISYRYDQNDILAFNLYYHKQNRKYFNKNILLYVGRPTFYVIDS